jgi:hypothetical protein
LYKRLSTKANPSNVENKPIRISGRQGDLDIEITDNGGSYNRQEGNHQETEQEPSSQGIGEWAPTQGVIGNGSRPENQDSGANNVVQALDNFLNDLLNTNAGNVEYVKSRTELGQLGELYCLEMEKKKLKALGISSEKYPVHVSKIHGDKHGFDVLSVDENMKPIMIEVKTTTNNRDSAFYITRNELEKMKNYSENFQVMRIFDFDRIKKVGNYYRINYSSLMSNYTKKPETYLVKPKS